MPVARSEVLLEQMKKAALTIFGRLPAPVRRLAVRLGTPNFTVGALCVLVHGDRVLVLCQRHRPDWSLPGGLLGRGEDPATAVAREVQEELGIDVEVGSPVTALVDPRMQRVDIVYRVDLDESVDVTPQAEVRYARWMRPDELGEGDWITRDVLTAVATAARPGSTEGRVVP
ncbi:MAG: NUDIX hydrolase [Actinomycetota bacterium]|nr:NUDIX hydrolase [Actinomycetota bacterium]